MQRALPRIISVQYFICEKFGKTFLPKFINYKALYGDDMFVSLSGTQIWPPKTKRNI